jgi:hypothetical protein
MKNIRLQVIFAAGILVATFLLPFLAFWAGVVPDGVTLIRLPMVASFTAAEIGIYSAPEAQILIIFLYSLWIMPLLAAYLLWREITFIRRHESARIAPQIIVAAPSTVLLLFVWLSMMKAGNSVVLGSGYFVMLICAAGIGTKLILEYLIEEYGHKL